MLTLQKRQQFVSVARGGIKVAAKGVVVGTLKQRQAPDNALPRVGFTATKKLGNAVVRNRIKRRLRAAFSEIASQCALPGHDYVVIGRKNTLNREYAALLKDLKYAVMTTHEQIASQHQTKQCA